MSLINKTKKVYEMFDLIFQREIVRLKKSIADNKSILEECKIFLEAAYDSINNSLKLLDDNNFIDSLCLLRSSFEGILFSIALNVDKDVLDAYKVNNSAYRKYLNNKNKEEKLKNPKFKQKKSKELLALQPSYIRDIVSKKYREIFKDFFHDSKDYKEVKVELDEFYSYLCDFTHPSMCKVYMYKLQNDIENLKNIKIVYKLNVYYCQMLLLLTLNYFYNNEDITKYLDLYAIIFLLSLTQIEDVKNLKNTLKKYEEYLYIDTTKNYLKSNHDEIEKLQKEIKDIENIDGINDIVCKTMLDIVKQFNAYDLLYKIQ